MFAQSVDGAHALCLYFSLIRTTVENGLSPYRYYVELLKAIPRGETVEDFEKLLPWALREIKPNLSKRNINPIY